MASKVPLVKQTSRSGLFLLAIVVAVYGALATWLGPVVVGWFPNLFHAYPTLFPMFVGAGLLLALLLTHHLIIRFFVNKDFTRAVKQLRDGKIDMEVIALFEKADAFFQRHPWIDRWRAVVLLSPSLMTYREICQINIAYCYGQIGNKADAKRYYQKTLELNSQNTMALSALRLIETYSQADEGDSKPADERDKN